MSEVVEKPWGRIVVMDDGTQVPVIKDRRLYVVDEDFSLSVDSLTGSAFLVLVDREMLWKGVVVGEPAPGRYLCEIEVLEAGVGNVQRVFALDALMGLGDEARRLIENSFGNGSAPIVDPFIEWRMYDSERAAAVAYAAWTSARTGVVTS